MGCVPDYERHDWLARRVESPLDPSRRIVDAHHHLWDRPGSRYLAGELTTDAAVSHRVTHSVFVECSSAYDEHGPPHMAPVGETRFVVDQAAQARQLGEISISAIVGHADLARGDAAGEVLDAHIEAGQGLFRGVRHGTNWSPHADVKNGHHHPNPGLLGEDAFRNGVRQLAQRGLSFDAWLYFDQLLELADLANAVPDCAIVLDHLGGPLGIGPHAARRDEMREMWRAGLQAVAKCPNVTLKVGGIGMEHYFGTDWASRDAPPSSEEVADHWREIVTFAIDTFGPHRCMFESNFPVDRQTLPYGVLWNTFEILAAPYDEHEQADLFMGAAARAYRIDVS